MAFVEKIFVSLACWGREEELGPLLSITIAINSIILLDSSVSNEAMCDLTSNEKFMSAPPLNAHLNKLWTANPLPNSSLLQLTGSMLVQHRSAIIFRNFLMWLLLRNAVLTYDVLPLSAFPLTLPISLTPSPFKACVSSSIWI